jgi:hypothetical protein
LARPPAPRRTPHRASEPARSARETFELPRRRRYATPWLGRYPIRPCWQ